MERLRQLIVITGLSGAGKTVALHTLEDFGYYCIDNLPVGLIPYLLQPPGKEERRFPSGKAALGIDTRALKEDLSQLPDTLRELKAQGINVFLLFLESSEESLVERFQKTRRRHPLERAQVPLAQAILQERQLLGSLREWADLRLDTSRMHSHELSRTIRQTLEPHAAAIFLLHLASFGYRNGLPRDADFVFDARGLPNPYWETRLRALTGRDPSVAAFLDRQQVAQTFLAQIVEFLERCIPSFESTNRISLSVAVGCTGGQHRSVYVVERLARLFLERGRQTAVRHRDLSAAAAGATRAS